MAVTPPRLLLAAAGTALAVLVSACGSSGSTAASTGPPPVSRVATGKDMVSEMVLNTGDLPGFSLHTTGAEALKDQLPPAGMRQFALIRRLVSANWIASEHSIVVSTDGHVQLFSDANLFKAADAARRLWKLEGAPPPGERIRWLRTPAGAPAGARVAYVRHGAHAAFEISWVQGRVIAFIFLGAAPTETFTRVGEQRISALLAAAGGADARRIANVEDGASTT